MAEQRRRTGTIRRVKPKRRYHTRRDEKAGERRKVEPKTGCCSSITNKLELAKCLLWDHWSESGAHYDADPFGSYRTESDGSVVFEQTRITSPRYVNCRSPKAVENLVAKVLLTAAKHARRYLVVTEETLKSTLWRLGEGQTWTGKGLTIEGAKQTPALPDNIVVRVTDFPENVGWLSYECGRYGISLSAPHKINVFEVVKTPTKTRTPLALS